MKYFWRLYYYFKPIKWEALEIAEFLLYAARINGYKTEGLEELKGNKLNSITKVEVKR